MEFFLAKVKNLIRWSSNKKGNLEVQQKQKQGDNTAIQQAGQSSEAHIGDTDQSVVIKDSVLHNPVFNNFDKSQIQQVKYQNTVRLEDRLKKIPQEQVVPVKPYQAYKALMGLQFVDEKVIADMFIELLAKAGDKRYAGKVFSRYQGIVEGLSPDDAKILEVIYFQKYKVMFSKDAITQFISPMREQGHSIPDISSDYEIPLPGIPFITTKKTLERALDENYEGGYDTVYDIFTDKDRILPHKSVKELAVHFYILQSLGLVDINTDTYFLIEEAYHHLIKHPDNKDIDWSASVKGRIMLTELGKQFLDVVFKDKNDKIKQ